MKVALLDNENLSRFKEYCIKFRKDHDDSYLYDEDLEILAIEKDNPGFLLIENDEIIGALSLVADDYYLSGQKARVRIFHCIESNFNHYEMLLDSLLPSNLAINEIEMFVPTSNKEVKNIINKLLFKYYRTSYVMIRRNKEKVSVSFDEGFVLKPFVQGRDEVHYMNIRNIAFKNLKGSETPMSIEHVTKLTSSKELLNKGIQILWHHDIPVGVIRMVHEEENNIEYSFVAPIAIIPEYQGRGLGTKLLKAGIMIGYENNIYDSMLAVNGENEDALKLYRKTGFQIDLALDCYCLYL